MEEKYEENYLTWLGACCITNLAYQITDIEWLKHISYVLALPFITYGVLSVYACLKQNGSLKLTWKAHYIRIIWLAILVTAYLLLIYKLWAG